MTEQRSKAASAKSLFRAMKRRTDYRDPLDYDPTPPDATAAFLRLELPHITAHGGTVWESAVGGGHCADVLAGHGLKVYGSDIVNRGWSGTMVRPFYDWDGDPSKMALPPSRIMVTNPPFNEISARDGHGRWLRHALALDADYIGLLLSSDWSAARINGHDELFRLNPPSIEYLCAWKIDFRGLGNAPQRNSWFVWDKNRPAAGPNMWLRARLYRYADSPDKKGDEFVMVLRDDVHDQISAAAQGRDAVPRFTDTNFRTATQQETF